MSEVQYKASPANAFLKDKLSGAIIVIDTWHAAVHAGIAFGAAHKAAISNGANLDFRFVVPSGVEAHFDFFSDTNGNEVDLLLYEGSSLSGGTAMDLVCQHRGDSKVSSRCTLTHTPTVTAAGTLIRRKYQGGSGDLGGVREELVLPAGTYLLRATNNNAQSVNALVGIRFYEEIES